jgi:hypothetical protein
MGGSSNTGQYKSFKEIPLWLKLVIVGAPALVLCGVLIQLLVSLKTNEFDAQIQEKTDGIHRQIAEGKFRDIFLEGDRELVSSYEENEFAARFAESRQYFTGKDEKRGLIGPAGFPDLANRLKRLVGRPALLVSHYTFDTGAGAGYESFYWMARGGEIKLADYRFSFRNYK